MAEKRKFYVVWEGRDPGVYDNWDDCLAQVEGFPGAKYKSFKSQQEAVEAFRGNGEEEETLLTRIALKNLESIAATSIPSNPAPATPAPIGTGKSRFNSSRPGSRQPRVPIIPVFRK